MSEAAQIFGYILASIGVLMSFILLHRKQYRLTAVLISFSFFTFAAIQLFSNGIVGKSDIKLEQFICWGFSLAFFLLAVYFAHKNSLSYAFAILIMSAFSAFCGLSGVQSFLKTHMLWQVTSSLKAYGDKIDRYQTNIMDMQEYLTEQQKNLTANQQKLTVDFKSIERRQEELASQQMALSNEFVILSAMSNHLATVEKDISNQQTNLSDVTYWVQNLYSNAVEATYSITDTNHIKFYRVGDHDGFIVRMDYAPIIGSLETYINYDGSVKRMSTGNDLVINNLFYGQIWNYDTNKISITIHYVADTRRKDIYPRMFRDGEASITPNGLTYPKLEFFNP